MKKTMLLAFLFVFTVQAFAQDYSGYLSSGLDAYARSDWASAIFSFQRAEDISNGLKDEPVYWAVMANASARNYREALRISEDFLKRFPGSLKTGEVIYQQGRMYCLCAEHEKSINILYGFLRRYPNHRQVPSAYYWIGENLYMAGRFKDARIIFSRIILDYPASAKVSPSRYKIALIDQASTQDELLKLLKLSHEELLKLSEEHEKNKRSYEQAIMAYQKQSGEVDSNNKFAEIAEKLQLERNKNEELHEKLTLFELKNKELLAALEASEKALEEAAVSVDKEEVDPDLEKRNKFIQTLKEQAKLLQDMYDGLLEDVNEKQ